MNRTAHLQEHDDMTSPPPRPVDLDADAGATSKQPALISLVRQPMTACLDHTPHGDDRSWTELRSYLSEGLQTTGRIERK